MKCGRLSLWAHRNVVWCGVVSQTVLYWQFELYERELFLSLCRLLTSEFIGFIALSLLFRTALLWQVGSVVSSSNCRYEISFDCSLKHIRYSPNVLRSDKPAGRSLRISTSVCCVCVLCVCVCGSSVATSRIPRHFAGHSCCSLEAATCRADWRSVAKCYGPVLAPNRTAVL